MKIAVLASFLLGASAAYAQDGRPADCLLVVAGAEIIRGACLFTPIDKDGSFQISALNGKYFAQVLMDRPGEGTGWWNETPYAGHAHSPLGTLRREDACWTSDRVSVCAW